MSAPEYVVPPVLRSAMFVPRQAPGRREPARVTAGAFAAAGLPVPEQPGQRNVYQLTGRQGLPWSPGIDAHLGRRGGELLGGGRLVLVDIDVPAAVDGSPMVDSFRWLNDRAVEAGELLDLTATLSVRTPGHPESGHLPGWHLWYQADPDYPVRMGPLSRCRAVELRARGTCPGSPGYEVWSAPTSLPVLPRWIGVLAGPPRAPVTVPARAGTSPAWAVQRLQRAIADLLDPAALRNNSLYRAACRAGDAGLDEAAAVAVLMTAANDVGLVAEDGEARCLATIRSGLAAGAAGRQAVTRG